MQLNQFRFLVAVDKYGSISRAAQELYISQSTVSLALINLEEELGCTILNRSKRGVSFTAEGKQVLRKAKAIMEEVIALQSLEFDTKQVTGEVRLGANSHFGMNIVTDVMLQLRRQYPGLCVLNRWQPIKDVIKAVAQKELDIGFINFNSLNETDVLTELQRYRLDFHPTFQDRLRICVGDQHPLCNKHDIPFAELLPYDMVSLSFKVDEFLYRFFQERGYEKEPVSLNDILNLRKYAYQTDALLFVLEKEIENSNHNYPYRFYSLDVPEFDVTVSVGWLHHSDHEMTTAECKTVEQLERECQRYQDLNEKE